MADDPVLGDEVRGGDRADVLRLHVEGFSEQGLEVAPRPDGLAAEQGVAEPHVVLERAEEPRADPPRQAQDLGGGEGLPGEPLDGLEHVGFGLGRVPARGDGDLDPEEARAPPVVGPGGHVRRDPLVVHEGAEQGALPVAERVGEDLALELPLPPGRRKAVDHRERGRPGAAPVHADGRRPADREDGDAGPRLLRPGQDGEVGLGEPEHLGRVHVAADQGDQVVGRVVGPEKVLEVPRREPRQVLGVAVQGVGVGVGAEDRAVQFPPVLARRTVLGEPLLLAHDV
ncbi:MAG: hypothetical protein MUC63_11145, partial [Planctomycetes bacterium]|nr:hypothetical protein [Planctomycetota bacterium]